MGSGQFVRGLRPGEGRADGRAEPASAVPSGAEVREPPDRRSAPSRGGPAGRRPFGPGWTHAAVVRALASVAGLVLIWALAAHLLGDPARAPGPGQVLPALWQGLVSGRMWPDIGATLGRVAASFAIAMTVGTALGLLLGLVPRLDRWLDPWLVIFNNIPALVTIVLCYLWIGLNETAAVAAVALNKIPLVTVMLREGVRVLDPGLMQMARVYRMGLWARLRHIILPQLAPHLLSAARAGISLIWKIVLVVEFLGRSNGVGFRIHLNFQMFDITGVLSWALAFVLVMLAVEVLVLAPLSRHLSRWRQE